MYFGSQVRHFGAFSFLKRKEEYVERYHTAEGKTKDGSLGGFARLTNQYNFRRIRDHHRDISKLDAEPFYNHLTYRQRISQFLRTKKKRLLFVVVLTLTFNFYGNLMG